MILYLYTMELDTVDTKILEILQKEGRISLRDLAKRIGISTPTASDKVKRLENLKVIKGYAALINLEKLGEYSAVLVIKCKLSDVDTIANKLVRYTEIREIFVSADSKIHVKITAPSESGVKCFLNGLANIREILDYEYTMILKTLKEEQTALITEGIGIALSCDYCKGSIKGEPVRIKITGREYNLCCRICARELKEKYERLSGKKQISI